MALTRLYYNIYTDVRVFAGCMGVCVWVCTLYPAFTKECAKSVRPEIFVCLRLHTDGLSFTRVSRPIVVKHSSVNRYTTIHANVYIIIIRNAHIEWGSINSELPVLMVIDIIYLMYSLKDLRTVYAYK